MEQIKKVFTWPSREYQKMRKCFFEMTPFQKWKLLLDTREFILKLLGINLGNEWEINWRTPIVGIVSAEYGLLTFYTAHFFWNDNKITAVQPFVIMGAMIPVSLCEYARFI